MILIEGMDPPGGHQIVWINEEAKGIWEKSIDLICKENQNLEMLSVRMGHRDCGTVTINSEDYVEYVHRYPDLIFLPLSKVGRFSGFAHRHSGVNPGDPYFMYCVYGKDLGSVQRFKDLYDSQDHVGIGEMLGFPACCGGFFEEVWKDGFIDPIWQMAERTTKNKGIDQKNKIWKIWDSSIHCNPLLRYIGVRSGFHIPHSFDCEESIQVGRSRMDLMDDQLAPIAKYLLGMPMEWDCLHGVAVIRTPIFWIIVGSVPVPDRYVVRIRGENIPKEGVMWRSYKEWEDGSTD